MNKYVNHVAGHALVLGGSGEIGREVVKALVANGASAISFTYGKNEEAAKKLAKELRKSGIKKVYYASVKIPTTDSEVPEFEEFLDDAVHAVGEEIVVAVNTVGISPNQTFEEQKIEGKEGWRDVYETNVLGSFLSTRAIAKRMTEKSVHGSITLITSTNGVNSQAEYSAHYDSSKAAQAHIVKTLAEPLAQRHEIRLNGVAPGWVDTSLNDSLPGGEREKEERKIWLKRFAYPYEIASVVAFIAGTGGSYIVGQNIMVDGGYR